MYRKPLETEESLYFFNVEKCRFMSIEQRGGGIVKYTWDVRKGEQMVKSNVFDEPVEIACSVCEKRLAEVPHDGLLVGVRDLRSGRLKSISTCCKGRCMESMQEMLEPDEMLSQQELSDLMNPNLFIRFLMNKFNEYCRTDLNRNEAVFEDYKAIITGIYPYVAREMNEEEVRTAKSKKIIR